MVYLILSLRPKGACRRTHDRLAATASAFGQLIHTLSG
jgi:hypothetical protein